MALPVIRFNTLSPHVITLAQYKRNAGPNQTSLLLFDKDMRSLFNTTLPRTRKERLFDHFYLPAHIALKDLTTTHGIPDPSFSGTPVADL